MNKNTTSILKILLWGTIIFLLVTYLVVILGLMINERYDLIFKVSFGIFTVSLAALSLFISIVTIDNLRPLVEDLIEKQKEKNKKIEEEMIDKYDPEGKDSISKIEDIFVDFD